MNILYCLSMLVIVYGQNAGQGQNYLSGQVIQSLKQRFSVQTITDRLDNPWGIAFLPDGRILVTERAGQIRIIQDGRLLDQNITGVPRVWANGQGGLLDIKLHPNYATNGWIYLTYSKPGLRGAGTTVSRGKITGNSMHSLEELWSARPFSNVPKHFGSRVVFDGQGHMFVSSGERDNKPNAQTLTNDLGKIVRLTDDGRVPLDNPFFNTPGAKKAIWSYGNRNPQGLVYDTATQTLWDIEHGPKGGDELIKVQKGANYGWPLTTSGLDYDGSVISNFTEREGLLNAVYEWNPSIGPCGAALVTGNRYPGWRNNLMIGALALKHLARVELTPNGSVVREERLLDGLARVRAVEQSPDGHLYVATETPGLLLKLLPQ